MPKFLKGSILIKAIMGVVHTLENSYNSSLLKKIAGGCGKIWKGSLLHRLLHSYVNKKPFYQSSLIYKLVMAIAAVFGKLFALIYRVFAPAFETSKIASFVRVVVGNEAKSRIYGAGLLLMAVPVGTMIAITIAGEIEMWQMGLCVGVFIVGVMLSFGIEFSRVINESLTVRFFKWVFSSLE